MAAPFPSPISPTPLSSNTSSLTTTSNTTTRPKRSALANVTSGRLQKPPRIVIYGVEGIGKSSFAASAPAPIFEGAEDGTGELKVKRLPQPHSFQDVLDDIDELTTEAHQYQTYVLDTIDWLEPLIHAEVCRVGGKENIEDFGFGKGYIAALDLVRVLLARLDRLRDARKMTIILCAHCHIKAFNNPEGDNYDRYEMKIHAKSGALIREWADATLFANYDITTYEKNQKTKAVSTKKRLIFTTKTAAFDAKNRYHLPEKLDLDWEKFEAARRATLLLDEEIEELIMMVSKADAKTATAARDWMKARPRAAHELAAMKEKLVAVKDRIETSSPAAPVLQEATPTPSNPPATPNTSPNLTNSTKKA